MLQPLPSLRVLIPEFATAGALFSTILENGQKERQIQNLGDG